MNTLFISFWDVIDHIGSVCEIIFAIGVGIIAWAVNKVEHDNNEDGR